MAWHIRFSRSLGSWGPFRLRLNKTGVSLTTKIGPVSQTRSTNGRRTTNVSLPGKGASLRSVSTPASRRRHRRSEDDTGARHRGQPDPRTDQEREEDVTREELRRRIAERRASIRRRRRDDES